MFKSLKQNNEEIQYYGFNIISQKYADLTKQICDFIKFDLDLINFT